jgi:hypothetical protein
MASDDLPQRSVKRAWRPEAVIMETPGGPEWRREEETAVQPGVPRRKRIRAILVGLIFFICAGLLVWLSFWLRPPRPAVLVLIGAGYEDNLAVPQNVYGRESMSALADLTRHPYEASFIRPMGLFRLKGNPTIFRRDSTDWLEGVGTFSEKTIILYFALHGGCDGKGPYLLPDNADLSDNERNRFRLTELLNRLNTIPKEKNKLVIFDATQVPASWGFGMLNNDFARGLAQLEPEFLKVPNLVVLSASDVNQQSWKADELQRTIFAHSLIEGLRGAAANDGTPHIDAWKLYNYVRDNVQQWTLNNRSALQTPVLLPTGAEGEKRARAMYLSMTQEPYQAPDLTKLPVFSPPAELTAAWNGYKELSQRIPSPAVYTPHLWRQYQASLLRYEDLLLAGDPGSATRMLKRLGDLKDEITSSQRLPLTSSINTLSMPAAVGMVSESSPKLVEMLNELWSAPADSEAAVWKEMQKKADPALVASLPLRLNELLYDRAVADPSANLTKAVALTREVRTPSKAPPAEIHFLRMLRRDVPVGPPFPVPYNDAIHDALLVRRQAERAAVGMEEAPERPPLGVPAEARYAYSEQVGQWTAAQIDRADAKRRLAEDLLFASDPASWAEARQLLRQEKNGDHAASAYARAQSTALSLRTCLAVRDKMLATLPAYSQWLGNRPPDRPDDELLKKLESLWEYTHKLTLFLEPGGDEPGKPAIVDFDELSKGAIKLEKEYAALYDQWKESWRESTAKTTITAWRDATDAMVVPDPITRLQLVSNVRRISRDILVRTAGAPPRSATAAAKPDGATAKQDDTITPAKAEKQAQSTARRQGRMALAVLGRRWFDDRRQIEVNRRERSEVVAHRLDILEGEEKWWDMLTRAGEQIAARYRDMPDEIRYQLEIAGKPDTPREEVLRDLRAADRLARMVPGDLRITQDPFAAANVPQENPPVMYRKWLMQDFLLFQAQRTMDDHWASEDPSAAEPYYQVAGQRYAKDADTLVPRQKSTDAMLTQLKLIERFKLESPRSLMATSELKFGGTWRLRPQPSTYVPRQAGRAVFWLKTPDAISSESPPAGTRLVEPVSREQATPEIKVELTSGLLRAAERKPPPTPGSEVVPLVMRGLFRGEYIDTQTDVHLYPLADVTVSDPTPPRLGGIVVRAPKDLQKFGAGMGSVAIVVDCSGSMGELPGTAYTAKTKYNQMMAVLGQVLGKMPKGTTLSMWVFGQAMGGRKTVDNAEETIVQVRKPTAWDPSQLKDLMTDISYPKREPWNESPIVRTILRAKADLVDATGFKTIVVLTDGMDNRFAEDKEFNPKRRSVGNALLDEFRDTGIALNIIGFKVVSAEEAQAKQQFSVVEQMQPPGKFYTVDEADKLALPLERAMRQRLGYWVDREDNSPIVGIPDNGLDVSQAGSNDQWFPGGLEPGGYKVRVNTPQGIRKSVIIDPGDLLILKLGEFSPRDGGDSRLDLRRGVFSLEDFPGKRSQTKDNWRMAVLQNQRLGADRVQMLLTLEKLPVPGEAVLQMVKPRQTWIEVVPETKNQANSAVRWNYQAGYPAPAWSLDAQAWPFAENGQTLAPPLLKVWWSPDLEAPAAAVIARGPTVSDLLKVQNQPVTVEGAVVRLDSVSVEDHYVETSPGNRTLEKCLVVRMTHDLGPTVWARPGGVKFEGQEHRFYREANKYTGLFWPVTEGDAAKALQSIGVISLNAFKRDAEQRGFFIQDRMPAPQASEVRPQPLSGGKKPRTGEAQ